MKRHLKPEPSLNYSGDRRGSTFLNGRVGPTTAGEYLYPVDAEYDPETDRTRVTFSRIVQDGAA